MKHSPENSNSEAYSQYGSRTTRPISTAPYSIQLVWNYANKVGASIVRIRQHKTRYENTRGDTFLGTHRGLSSVYITRAQPKRTLWYKKLLGIGKANTTMQIFEIPKGAVDLDEVCTTLREADKQEISYPANALSYDDRIASQ